MSKPLTKEEREAFARYGAHQDWEMDNDAAYAIGRALEAEAYWREAVKNSDSYSGNGACHFCNVFINGANVPHKPDCPWLLAQE